MGAFIGTPIYRQRARIKVGSYTGDGTDNRNINIGVNLTAKNNVWVIIKSVPSNRAAIHRPEMGQGDLGQLFIALMDTANTIQGLTATGFQIGSNAEVNITGELFRYIVIWDEP